MINYNNSINSLEDCEYYSLNGNNILLNEENLLNLNEYDIKRTLISIIKEVREEKNISKDLKIEFKKNSTVKSKIIDIVSEDFPLLRISRLEDGDSLINFNFGGIKNINDSYGDKGSIDRCLNKIKLEIQNNLSNFKNQDYLDRVIRKNYKHLTIDYRNSYMDFTKEDFANFLRISEDNFKNFLDEVLEDENNNLVELFKDSLSVSIGKGKVEGEILEDKSFAFYSSEMNSRMDSEDFGFDELKDKSEQILNIEKKLEQDFGDNNFELLGVKHKIFIDNDNRFGGINPILIEAVRKNEDIGDFDYNRKLSSDIKNYLENLNLFDFIAPYINSENSLEELEEEVGDIENGIHDGFIKADYIEKNYKGTLNRTALLEYSKGKKGLRVFVDIASMGIMNISEFRELAKRVEFGEITEKNKVELLNSGMQTTLKFIRFVKNVQQKYFDAELSLGGDEVFICFPDLEEGTQGGVLNSIGESLKKESLSGRTSYSFKEDNQESLYNDLDNITFISKKIEKLVRKFTPAFNDMPSLVKVDISDNIRKYIVSEEGDYEKNLQNFLQNFEEQLLSSEGFTEKIDEIKQQTGSEVDNILGEEIPLFTFFPKQIGDLKHNFYFQRSNGILKIRISEY